MSEAAEIEVSFTGRLGGFAVETAFTAPGHGITALFGPSGSGKTSILRCVAGLQRLDGTCRVGGEVWQDGRVFLPAWRRPIGYVFQEASLFPHLSVRGNLLNAARGKAPAPGPGLIGFDEVVELLGLTRLMERETINLSGGERQRVAVGRALLSQPRLLLMDEPLSALDRPTRDEILPFLERLHETLAIPVLYVSHDLSEVERLADHLVLMQAGKVVASGPLQDIQSNTDLPLALQRDAAVSLEATIAGYDEEYGILKLDVDGGVFQVPGTRPVPSGRPVRLRVGAGDVSLAREAATSTSILNILPARIVSVRAADERQMIVLLRLGEDGAGARLLARVTRKSWDQLGLAEGLVVHAQIKSVALASR